MGNNGHIYVKSKTISHHLALAKVMLKFIAPNNELIPDKCRPNIAKSTLAPL
jgi:hypothetical protein